MSTEDFQERLRRISTGAPQYQAVAEGPGRAGAPQQARPGFVGAGIGGAMMALGLKLIRDTNQNYEAIRDGSGLGTAAGLGVLGMALALIGIVVILRSAYRLVNPPAAPVEVAPRRTPSTGARVFFSLLGAVMGAVAGFYLFLAGAGHLVGTETGERVATGSVGLAMMLAAVALLVGFLGLFLRGRGLGRVLAYFFIGGAVVWTVFRLFRINLLEWQTIASALQ